MKLKIKKTMAIFKIFLKTIQLLWETSPKTFILILFIDFLAGAIIPVGLWVWKEFIDAVTQVLINYTGHYEVMFFWLCIHFLLMLLNSILGNLSNYVQNVFSATLNKTITEKTLNKISSLDMKDFDDADTYN